MPKNPKGSHSDYISAAKAAAMTKEERDKWAARDRLKHLTDWDIVKRYVMAPGDFDLTPTENNLLERLEFAKASFIAMHDYSEVLQMLQEKFNISRSTAARAVAKMKDIYGNLDEIPTSIKRQTAEQMALNAYKLALSDNNPDAAARAAAVYIKAAGLDKEQVEGIDIEKLQRDKVFVEVLDPAIRTAMLQMLKNSSGVMDMSKMFEEIHASAEDADFVEKNEDEE